MLSDDLVSTHVTESFLLLDDYMIDSMMNVLFQQLLPLCDVLSRLVSTHVTESFLLLDDYMIDSMASVFLQQLLPLCGVLTRLSFDACDTLVDEKCQAPTSLYEFVHPRKLFFLTLFE